MQSFLLPGMMAFGRITRKQFPIDSSGIEEYLSSVRKYPNIELQPLIVQTEESLENGWFFELGGDYAMIASHRGIYEIRLNDNRLGASEILDAIHGMMAVMHSVLPSLDELIVIPVGGDIIPPSRIIRLNDVVEIYKSTLPYTSDLYEYNSMFLGSGTRGFDFDSTLWRLVGHVIGDEQIIYASHFLRAAFDKYLFLGDDLEQVILRHDELPSLIMEAVNVENAVHNAYKVVEAIYGGSLASDWRKVGDRLASKGIDTSGLVGYTTHGIFQREPVLEKIKHLKHARDDRAAHGRIHQNRRNTYYELMDYQAVATHLLDRYIRFKYPQTVNSEENKGHDTNCGCAQPASLIPG